MNDVATATRSGDHGHVESRADNAMLQRKALGSLEWHWDVPCKCYPSQASCDGQRHSLIKRHRSSAAFFRVFFCVPSLFSLRICFDLFFLLRRGSRIEIQDLIWGADEVTTILGNASSNRIHVRTLIGIAQLFYDFNKAVVPTRLFFFGLPWSIAGTKVFEELAICELVHLRQLHGARVGRVIE